jgi:hypothetical protein
MVCSLAAVAQTDSVWVSVNGTVTDKETPHSQLNLMILNKRTGYGEFGDGGNSFSTRIRKNDVLLISALGYQTKSISFVDSTFRKVYSIRIELEKLKFKLPEVEVFPERDLAEIKKDIDQLGYNESDYLLSGVDAFQSPITALYMLFSKREKEKRKVAELQNDERRRDLLKELFRRYVSYDIIELDDKDFDDFIDFCNIPDALLQNTTQYEFVGIIEQKFKYYQRVRVNRRY